MWKLWFDYCDVNRQMQFNVCEWTLIGNCICCFVSWNLIKEYEKINKKISSKSLEIQYLFNECGKFIFPTFHMSYDKTTKYIGMETSMDLQVYCCAYIFVKLIPLEA